MPSKLGFFRDTYGYLIKRNVIKPGSIKNRLIGFDSSVIFDRNMWFSFDGFWFGCLDAIFTYFV